MAVLRRARMDRLCEVVTDGTHDSPKLQKEGVPFIKGKHISGGTIDFSTCDFITREDHVQACKRVKPQRGDVLFSNIGSVGDTAVVKDDREFSIKNVALFRPDRRKVHECYFYYVVLSPSFRSNVLNVRSGSAQPFISLENLRSFEVSYHEDLDLQRRIASILSAYDELIENSQRRIKILETMARALYREWFVHFRFPGHENHPRVASPLGEIPKGWEVTTLRAVTTKIGSGATPRGGKESYQAEGIALIRSLNIYDYDFEFANLAFIDEQQAADLENVTVQENDILLNITGASVARCALAPSYLLPARVNQHVAIVRADPAKASPFYILDAINSDNRKAQLLALAQGGATREALTKDTVSNFEVVLPPRALMQRYDVIARGIHTEREVLLRQVQNLRRTRDLLLPRLLSGQIDVEAA